MRGAKHVTFILLIAIDLIQYKNGKQTFWQVNQKDLLTKKFVF